MTLVVAGAFALSAHALDVPAEMAEPVAPVAAPEAAGNSVSPAFAAEIDDIIEAQDQETFLDQEEYDLVLRLRRRSMTLSDSVIGLEKGAERYVPMMEIARILQFDARGDFANGRVEGFFINEQNTYSVDAVAGQYTVRGETHPLPPGSVIVRSVGYGLGEVFIKPEVLNQIWPLELELNFSDMALHIKTPATLPYELVALRKQRQEKLLAGADEVQDRPDYPFIPNDYQAASPPAVTVTNSLAWNNRRKDLIDGLSVQGTNDLAYMSAEYGVNMNYNNHESFDVTDARFKLSRQAFGNDTMPLGAKLVELGDVTDRPPEQVGHTLRGRGALVSSKAERPSVNFDEVVIQGFAQPGWEVEIYRRNELLDFGTVDETGEYRFENVPLLFGNNEIRTVLYGPQGQTEERVENHTISSNMLTPGDSYYEASILEAGRPLIPTAEEDPLAMGVAKNLHYRHGVTDWLTAFGSYSGVPTREDPQDYVTAGAVVSALGGLGQVEAYKQIDGGTALDTRFTTEFAKVKLNLRHAQFNDFESEEVGFGDRAKTSETEARLSRSFKTPVGNLRLGARGVHTEMENDTSRTFLETSQALGLDGYRLNNRTQTNLRTTEHRTTTGNLSLSKRLDRKWSTRGGIDYDIYPETGIEEVGAEIRYDDKDKITGAFEAARNFDQKTVRLGADGSYDFGTFLAGVDVNYLSGDGVDVRLRTTTSLGPFGEDGSYIASSESLTNRAGLKARVYLDKDLDGMFGPGDEPLEGAKLRINGRTTPAADSEGYIMTLNAGAQGYADIVFDRSSVENPFLVSGKEGYQTVLRSTTMPFIDMPVVESGGIDGNVMFRTGRPVAGLRVQIVDAEGKVIMETPTSSDGFFSFELVKPGTYTLRADPEHKVPVPPRTVTVAADELFAFGEDLTLIDPTPAERRSMLKNVVGKLRDVRKVLASI